MLLYGGPGVRSAEILDVGRNEEGAELVKGEPMGDAPLGELARGPGVSLPGVAVTDAGGEEFDELEPGLFARVPEENRHLSRVRSEMFAGDEMVVGINHGEIRS